ncbi:glycoside hydrolase family 3 C-terminal domain-containing protein [Nguyenibacter sp. L1]|uniref:beta-glucosidase n=1 Tax=Nguyenibacter sp. L1 TaxID=3049350 RepID=UPI002B4A93DE|nr:glycoside hydrolase family 3 C-terminal domain-containing protein [Nguyenibacter sp. L1]WRH89386.1 glycoside hydrolase family 3 C-terminal domain-containing protein [Nguyenibacter sp. L1]
MKRLGWVRGGLCALVAAGAPVEPVMAQDGAQDGAQNGAPTAAQRADALLRHMLLQDQLALVFSRDGGGFGAHAIPRGALGSAAFLLPPAHLGLPALEETDAGLGVGDPRHVRTNGPAVSLPSGLATAGTWDVAMARAGGAMIGAEAWRNGFNVLLAGGADLTRDPRNGRNFEYAGEDPLLTGRIVGQTIAGIQSRHVISTLKHFAMNDLETSRMTLSANIAPAAMRESDLLGFEIAIETGHPGAVMCSYNRVNDLFACENAYLLTKTLKQDWHYPGFVMSDWGADHTTVRAALAGLDQESSGDTIDARPFFGPMLVQAVQAGAVPRARIADMARRVLYAVYDVGLPEHPPVITPIDAAADTAIAEQDEEEGAVLLRNRGILPLRRDAHVLVIGGHADAGVISGGGSAQVVPIGGNAVPADDKALPWPGAPVYFPSAPLRAMQALAGEKLAYDPGTDPARAAQAARQADAVVIFATKWSVESIDSPDLSLPDGQDALIAAVARANPHVVVVLETGNPVLMPWLESVQAVMQAWYPGSGGGQAIARLLYGAAAPSGHLPITFPRAAAQLPRPDIAGVRANTVFDVQFHTDQEVMYDEGSEVGYRWFDARRRQPLFPFGFGLTYTDFRMGDLTLAASGHDVVARFTVRNVGPRDGVAVPQLYVTLPDGGGRRLAGWQRLTLARGESQQVAVTLEPRVLARFDDAADRWRVPAGRFQVRLATDAADQGTVREIALAGWTMAP